MNETIRLQKHIANLGICSRRKAEALIREGKVRVNGHVVRDMGVKIDPKVDTIDIIGEGNRAQTTPPKHLYIILNKPTGYICSASSAQGDSVFELITPPRQIGKVKLAHIPRVYPVGRLDKDSEGLVLLTNDGDLANRLTHPKFEHEKEYDVTIDQPLSKDAERILTKGMFIGDGEHVRGITIKKKQNIGKRHIITIVLREGKNRQVKKMFGRLGYHVLHLKRTRLGNLTLQTLPPGRWRVVNRNKIL